MEITANLKATLIADAKLGKAPAQSGSFMNALNLYSFADLMVIYKIGQDAYHAQLDVEFFSNN